VPVGGTDCVSGPSPARDRRPPGRCGARRPGQRGRTGHQASESGGRLREQPRATGL